MDQMGADTTKTFDEIQTREPYSAACESCAKFDHNFFFFLEEHCLPCWSPRLQTKISKTALFVQLQFLK